MSIKAANGDLVKMAPSIAILVLINGAPLAFFIVIKCNHSLLADEERKKSFGAIYNGKNVSKDDHRAQFYPLGFFWRRMLFIIITVYMFDYPLMQMIAHLSLTMVMMAFLVYDSQAFESKAQKYVEVGSELGLHFSSIMMSQFMDNSYSTE